MALRYFPLVVLALLAFGQGVTMHVPAHAQGQTIVDGETALANAAKAVQNGQYSSAVRQLTKVMQAEDLSTQQIAMALYLRGVANRNSSRPAQAISDITSALFLKKLAGRDQAEAYMNRAQAYQQVGLSDLARTDVARAKQIDPNAKVAAAPKPSGGGDTNIPAFSTQVQPSGSASRTANVPAFSTQVEPSSRPARQAQIPGFRTQVQEEARAPERQSIPSFSTNVTPNRTRVASRDTEPKPRPAPSPNWTTSVNNQGGASNTPQGEEESGGTVTRFLSGLWNKDEEEKKAPPPAAANQWNQTTRVATANRPASRPSAPAPVPQASSGGGGYRIQLAAVRSEAEAQATWKRLSSRHSSVLGGLTPVIQRTELGSMGTFYRVQLGPYSDKGQSKALCERFKQNGLDCFLLGS